MTVIGIDGLLDGLAALEVAELVTQQIPLDGVGMVEVVDAFLLVGEVAGILVVGILGNNHHLLAFELVGDGLYYRCFAGP